MYFYTSFSVCASKIQGQKEVMLCGQKMTSSLFFFFFSRTPQGNRGAPTPPYIPASFATGHIGVLSHHYPSLPTVTTGSLKCHPQRPKDDCWIVIGSAGVDWLLWSSHVFKKLIFIYFKWTS